MPGLEKQTIPESEIALFYEWMQSCAQIVLDDIVRDAIFQQANPE